MQTFLKPSPVKQEPNIANTPRVTTGTISRPPSSYVAVEREASADDDVLKSESFPLVPLERIKGSFQTLWLGFYGTRTRMDVVDVISRHGAKHDVLTLGLGLSTLRRALREIGELLQSLLAEEVFSLPKPLEERWFMTGVCHSC